MLLFSSFPPFIICIHLDYHLYTSQVFVLCILQSLGCFVSLSLSHTLFILLLSLALRHLIMCFSRPLSFIKFKGINHQSDAWSPVLQWLFSFSLTSSHTRHITSPSYPNITCNSLHIVFQGRKCIQHACMRFVPCPFPLFLTLWVTQCPLCVPNTCNNQPWISFLSLQALYCMFDSCLRLQYCGYGYLTQKVCSSQGRLGSGRGSKGAKCYFLAGKRPKTCFLDI